MKVETYEVEEINASDASTMAADAEAIQLCEKLGLKGQLERSNAETLTRFPYRVITLEEQRIFRAVCPVETNLRNYNRGPIPVRVLQVASYVSELEYCDQGLHVWHPASAADRDPFLIGKRRMPVNAERRWETTDIFLLARWGDELPGLDELRTRAHAILLAQWGRKLTEIVELAKLKQATLGNALDAHLRGLGSDSEPYSNL